MREDAFIAFAIDDLLIGIAGGLRAALQSDARVIFPKVLLAGHARDRGALLVPDRGDVEQYVRRPMTLFGLMRLEKKDRRRAEDLFAGLVPMRLRDDPRMLSEFRHHFVIAVIDVAAWTGEDESRMDVAKEIDEPIERLVIELDRV